MKKASTYIFSLILSVLMVFAIIGTLILAVVKISVSENSAVKITEKKNISNLVYSQLEKYYNEKYYSSGIPSEVYMGALNEDVIENIMKAQIKSAFDRKDYNYKDSDISGVEENLEKFFSSYADENDIEKDSKYNKKLENAKDNAKKVISDYCDVYKINTLKSQGINGKIYKILDILQFVFTAALATVGIVAVLLILFNIKEISIFLYWLGISCLVSGVMGSIPCIYLIVSNYFGSFTIKQPHIFMTYTGALNGMTEYFLIFSICTAVFGIFLITAYAVAVAKSKDKTLNQNTKIVK
ncbi:MAG: hypothetical protein IKS03_09730 [Ruminococcus sp.]|nr:hypothetical protein [Ruminococcus sp.]